jgi:hypothetical protein
MFLFPGNTNYYDFWWTLFIIFSIQIVILEAELLAIFIALILLLKKLKKF